MRRKWLILCVAIFAIALLFYTHIQRSHTFTLADGESPIKAEQIQPLFGTVKFSGDCDTDVVLTEIETGKTYVIGYLTPGVSEKVRLQRGQWYTVNGGGNLTVGPVNVRTE